MKKDTRPVSLTMDVGQFKALESIADAEDRSVSSVIRLAVEEFLDRKARKGGKVAR